MTWQRMRIRRELAGLTKRDLAHLTGITYRRIRLIETHHGIATDDERFTIFDVLSRAGARPKRTAVWMRKKTTYLNVGKKVRTVRIVLDMSLRTWADIISVAEGLDNFEPFERSTWWWSKFETDPTRARYMWANMPADIVEAILQMINDASRELDKIARPKEVRTRGKR